MWLTKGKRDEKESPSWTPVRDKNLQGHGTLLDHAERSPDSKPLAKN